MRILFRVAPLAFAAVMLSACAGFDPPGTTYVRTDGSAVATEQVEADRTACSQAAKPQHCMLERGYNIH